MSTQVVSVRYSKPGTQPPVYLAGSFTEPPWRIQEMEHTLMDNNEYDFHKEVEVEAGKEYQYKLRVGEGDWWILNEDAPTGTDNVGNRNNLLQVSPRNELEKTDTKMGADSTETTLSTSEIGHSVTDTEDTTTLPSTWLALATEKAASQSRDDSETPGKKAISEEQKVDQHKSSLGGVIEQSEVPAHAEESHQDLDGLPNTHGEKEEASPTETDDGYIKVRRMSEVAAEVADVAKNLDRDQPTPPISDEEAGRLGYRRMSATPIPEVANTAAEVADSAALLDKEHLPKLEMPERIDESGYDSGDETPFHERAPLFAHECLEPPSAENDYHFPQPQRATPPSAPVQYEQEDIDFNDPSLEEFPCDRHLILETVRSLETRLNEDPTTVEGIPPSPVVGSETNNHQPDHLELPSPPANLAVLERSPSLNSIAEEADGEEEAMTSLPSALNLNQVGNGFEDSAEPTVNPESSAVKTVDTQPSPVTPFIVGDRQLGEEATEPQQIPTSENTPDLFVTPATPGVSLKDSAIDPFNNSKSVTIPVDASSSAIEHDQSQVKARKPPAAAIDRPNTQNSLRSDDVKSRNLLRAFWRVVFVDWIGGLIMRLCGRRRTLVAVSAFTFLVTAPAVYYIAGW